LDERMFRVMFVCTGNTCRSPMAAGGLEKLLENNEIESVAVCSSGTAAASGYPATAYAIEAARIWDADISGHSSQPLTENLIEKADLIICMTPSHCREVLTMVPEAREKTFLLKNYPESGCDGEGVEDPIGGSLDMYNQTFLEIGEELGRILPFVRKVAESKTGEVGH
jgi:protein-tyrosine-phosphatase